MAGGGTQPGANSRGRGGKFRKFTRGGGKHFSRDLQPLDADGNKISMWADNARHKKVEDDSDEGSDEDSSEEDSDEDSDAGPSAAQAELSREERKKQKKAQKDAAVAKKKAQAVQVGDMPTDSEEESEDDDMPANPNHSKAARNQARAPVAAGSDEELAEGVKSVNISRKERESLEAAAAKEKYRKLHEAGKTDEAKADLARLREIREKRAAEAARRQAEKEEAEAAAKAKKAEIDAKEAKKREAALGPQKKKGKSAK